MLALARQLGFALETDAEDPGVVLTRLRLRD